MKEAIISTILIFVLIIAMNSANEVVDAKDSKKRLRQGILLFLCYSYVIEYYIYEVLYGFLSNATDTCILLMFGLPMINLIIFIGGLFFYFTKKKRKLSALEKMKLNDM